MSQLQPWQANYAQMKAILECDMMSHPPSKNWN